MYQNNNNIDWGGWILTIIMLGAFWPIGLVLLFRQLTGYTRKNRNVKRHPYDVAREQQNTQSWQAAQPRAQGWQPAAPVRSGAGTASRKGGWNKVKQTTPLQKDPKIKNAGGTLTTIGGILAGVFGFAILMTLFENWGSWLYYLDELFPMFGFFGGGLVCLYIGRQQRKKAKRYKKYLAYIGRNTEISIHTLASAMGVKEKTVYEDLQDMLDDGIFPVGYIDVSSGRLVLSDAGISEPEPQPEPEPEPEPAKAAEDENAILQEIREVNDAIPDEVMSAKIDRIGEITGKILDYQRSHPGKSSQLRSFLNYYLPTTLKVLRAYAQLDAQGIEGENISAAKKRIEGMMDQVVDGFEKQLDKLFADDALDITSDVEVLENMLRKDGLSGGMTLGSVPAAEADSGFSAQQTYLDLQKVAEELEEKDAGSQGLTLGG